MRVVPYPRPDLENRNKAPTIALAVCLEEPPPVPMSSQARLVWHRAVHDLRTTQERLHKIHLQPTDKCTHCGNRETFNITLRRAHALPQYRNGPEDA